MKPWAYWFPDILPHVPNCPIPLVEHELRRAAQDFFTATRAWQVTLLPIAISAGTDAVPVPVNSDSDLVQVEGAWYEGVQMKFTTPDALDLLFSDDWRMRTGTPSKLIQFGPGIVSLYPIPISNSSIGLKLRVSVRPSESAIGISDEMAVKFRSEIETGAKAKLMLYPAKPWTNVEMAAAYMQMFNGMVASGNVTVDRSYRQGRIASRPSWS